MIEAAISESCGVGGYRHERGVATKLLLHGTNRTLQPNTERLG